MTEHVLPKFSCWKCEDSTESEIVVTNETNEILGKTITYKTKFIRCKVCGEEYQTGEMLDYTLGNIRFLTNINCCVYDKELDCYQCTADYENQLSCKFSENMKKCPYRSLLPRYFEIIECLSEEAHEDAKQN